MASFVKFSILHSSPARRIGMRRQIDGESAPSWALDSRSWATRTDNDLLIPKQMVGSFLDLGIFCRASSRVARHRSSLRDLCTLCESSVGSRVKSFQHKEHGGSTEGTEMLRIQDSIPAHLRPPRRNRFIDSKAHGGFVPRFGDLFCRASYAPGSISANQRTPASFAPQHSSPRIPPALVRQVVRLFNIATAAMGSS